MRGVKITHTIDTLLARTEEIGNCLEWQSTMSSTDTPVVKHSGRYMTVRRLIRELEGRPVPRGHFAVPSCGNTKCIRPSHIVERTMSGHASEMASRVEYNSPLRLARLQKLHAHKRVLTWEKVEMIRSDPRTAGEVAAEVGCSKSLVKMVRRGEAYLDRIASSNPFAQLMR